MEEKLTFVLSGGGSRGALQVGALYALLEEGFQPDLLVGTSIGSVNATFLAINGFSKDSLDHLAAAWREVVDMDLLPANYFWLAIRTMMGRSYSDPSRRIREFLVAHGLSEEMRFADFQSPRLVIVSSDLNSGQPVLHGDDLDENVLEAVLFSSALPPWVLPVKRHNRYLMDGGVVSNLPVQPALRMGATRIVALDLTDVRDTPGVAEGVPAFLEKLSMAVERRQADLELELAAARGVPLLYLGLASPSPIALWDFRHTDELMEQGYEIARQVLKEHPGFRPGPLKG